MYSDYFDEPEEQSRSVGDDANEEDEIMDDVEIDEGSSDNDGTGANELNVDHGTGNKLDKDEGPKSTLEKQQEKVC